MAATVFLAPGPFGAGGQFFTTGGIVLNGGLINTYLAGTTTPQATFTTSAGNVQNANPIVLNSDGRPPQEIWLTAGISYKFTLTDSLSSLIGTYDNLYGVNDPASPVDNQNPIPITSVAGTANAITGAIPGNISAYAARQLYRFIPTAQNTGATAIVLTPSGGSALASRNIFLNGQALTGGELRLGIPTVLEDDGTQLNIVGNGYLVQGVSSGSVTSAATINLDNTSGDYPAIFGGTLITAVTLAPGRERTVLFTSSTAISSNAVNILPGGTTITSTVGDAAIIRGEAGAIARWVAYQRANGTATVPARGVLAGLTLSTAGSSATMSIAAGQATDSTNTLVMGLASALAKTTSAWAVGNAQGGLDTGAIANATWYHFHLIMRPDTGIVDVLISLSPTAPTMPANYIFRRRIGSGLTNGSAQWTAFIQDGDLFQWLVPVANVSNTNPGTSAISATLTTPLGVNVGGWISGLIANVNTNNLVALFSDLATTDSAPDSTTFWSIVGLAAGANSVSSGDFYTRTNTVSQIRYRLGPSTGVSDLIRIATKGWTDRRGRDA